MGVTPRDQDPATAAPNHNPRFFVDEGALVVGTRALASLAVNALSPAPRARRPPPRAQPFAPDEP